MEQKRTPFEALEAAVAIAGGQSAFGRLCGKAQPTVWKWLQSSKRLPPDHVLTVEASTGVSRHELRPDIYPIEQPHPPVPNDDKALISARGVNVACDRQPISQRGATR